MPRKTGSLAPNRSTPKAGKKGDRSGSTVPTFLFEVGGILAHLTEADITDLVESRAAGKKLKVWPADDAALKKLREIEDDFEKGLQA